MPKLSEDQLSCLVKRLYLVHSCGLSSEPPKEDLENWTAIAREAEAFFRDDLIQPGMKSVLFASVDFPDTPIEVVSVSYPTIITVKFPDGTTRDIDRGTLIDWCSDWSCGDGLSRHIDTFHEVPRPHPITGAVEWVPPDLLKAEHLLAEEHTHTGNCQAGAYHCQKCGEGNLCDVCHEHCQPRGQCEDCPVCLACP